MANLKEGKYHSQMDFDTIYTTYYLHCYMYARSYLRDDEQAKDIASEAMVALWEALQTQEIYHVRSFLMTTVKNKSLNQLREERKRLSREQEMLDDSLCELDFRISSLNTSVPEEVIAEDMREFVRKVLETLPPQTQRVFYLRRYEGKNIKEIAAEMGISIKGVDYHVTKAMKLLRKRLKDYLYMFF
ncbi:MULTISPECIES: RNA polymerase sigma-70 factor [Prevotella]|nr:MULTISPECIES: RNA polymerase sigma-70 factor [Prevotella]